MLQKECSRIEDTFKKTEEQLEKERLDNAHIVEELTREVCCYVIIHRNGGRGSESGYFGIYGIPCLSLLFNKLYILKLKIIPSPERVVTIPNLSCHKNSKHQGLLQLGPGMKQF